MFRALRTGIVALTFVGAPGAEAYPSFIGYGYTSCLVCHFNAFGNGALTDYGRAVGASAIAAKPFWSSKTDEQLAESSGFLGATALPDFVRFQADYRGLILASDLTRTVTRRYVPMVAGATLVLRTNETKFYAVGNLGYAATPATYPKKKPSPGHLITREHYLGWRITERAGVQAGLMDMVYGIRVPDHVAYSRAKTLVAQNDQTHGVAFHYGAETWETGLHAFAGNLLQDKDLRLVGVSSLAEFDVAEKWRLGGSVSVAGNSLRSRRMASVQTRVGAGEGNSVMFETGFIHQRADVTSFGQYAFFQSMTRAFRGFHVLLTGEYYTERAFEPSARVFRFGPAIQYFPFQRAELRVDLLGTRGISGATLSEDTFNLMGQFHLWL